MRGIAALTVVGFHVSNPFSAGPASGWFDGLAFRILTAFFNGFGAVVIFFVLSGFVLARSLDANSNPTRFFRNRFFRLFPAKIFTVTLLTALALFGEKKCRTPEEFKAWSQNFGHEQVLTTFSSYGAVPPHRQSEIIG